MLTLLLGGARSGKSALALRLAHEAGAPVTFVATAEAGDEEMAARIATHRAERPRGWVTVEEPVHLQAALSSVPDDATVVVDCLTLWVANLTGTGMGDSDVVERAAAVAALAAARPAPVVVISNEVGWGIVPADAPTRRYRDLLGRVNATFALHAQQAFLVVAGRALALHELLPGTAGRAP
jgi:adenosyl cobinamide kinase/adenosyl cobinamide phosphate guanylyltransferase